MGSKVLLYELNEVPWKIIDLYVKRRPRSTLAQALPLALSLTTRNDDVAALEPWRTWPTLHNSMYVAEHNSWDLGQDPATFRGVPLWDAVDRAGKVVGLFGPLQSWPAKPFKREGFYVPDTFSSSNETFPASLSRFQAFNLAMTSDNTFSPEGMLSALQLVRVGADVLRLGMTPRSATLVARHLARELREPRTKASRSTMQALPSFDLFWKLHRHYSPDLSIFFTNHVAGMMHRYWGDGVPGYQSTNAYRADDVYAGFLLKAMDIFDRQLSTALTWVKKHEDVVLVVASSMGQDAIDKEAVDETFVLESTEQLGVALGFRGDQGLAMYPSTTVTLANTNTAAVAGKALQSVRTERGPLFDTVRVVGRSVSVVIDQYSWGRPRTRNLSYVPVGHRDAISGTIEDLGVSIRHRMGGGNTAWHVPAGMMMAFGQTVRADSTRVAVDVRDVAPSILALLDVPSPPSFRGEASIRFVAQDRLLK